MVKADFGARKLRINSYIAFGGTAKANHVF